MRLYLLIFFVSCFCISCGDIGSHNKNVRDFAEKEITKILSEHKDVILCQFLGGDYFRPKPMPDSPWYVGKGCWVIKRVVIDTINGSFDKWGL